MGRLLGLLLLVCCSAKAQSSLVEPSSAPPPRDHTTPRRNLITIVTDDQGRWALGAYGNQEIRTPHMDRIAREGALFTQALVATPVCSPSRATWLSGRYPTEIGITDWIAPIEAREGLGLRGTTWPRVLLDNGYSTALFGKWHLGEKEEFHPTRLGFQTFMGFLAGGNRPMDPELEVSGRKTFRKGALPDLLTTAAIDWLRAHREGPFALALHFRAPHLPYGPVPEEDTAPYKDLVPTIPSLSGLDREQVQRRTRNYYASISSVDRNVGRLLAALDELQLRANTVVLFASDHGYNEGRHHVDTKGNGHWIAGGLSGPKRPNMWDTSIAIPLLIRWPGVVKPGTRIDTPISNVDVFRTLLGVLEIPVPKDSEARGVDCSPLLRGEPFSRDDAVFGQYDLHNGGLAYLRMIRTKRFKLVKHFHARFMDELYDLDADPDERRNIYSGNAQKELPSGTVAALEKKLRQWMEEIKDPLLVDRY